MTLHSTTDIHSTECPECGAQIDIPYVDSVVRRFKCSECDSWLVLVNGIYSIPNRIESVTSSTLLADVDGVKVIEDEDWLGVEPVDPRMFGPKRPPRFNLPPNERCGDVRSDYSHHIRLDSGMVDWKNWDDRRTR